MVTTEGATEHTASDTPDRVEHRAECSRGWAGRCARSTGKRCRCACGGHNHGGARRGQAIGGDDGSLAITPRRQLEFGLDETPTRTPIEELLVDDTRVLVFAGDDAAGPRTVLLDGVPLAHRYVKHSPTGFSFGYGGSGPADLALNILALVIPVKEAAHYGLYHRFKFAHIATASQGDTLSLRTVRKWIADEYLRELRKDGVDVVESSELAAV
jgi:hypothetical protein